MLHRTTILYLCGLLLISGCAGARQIQLSAAAHYDCGDPLTALEEFDRATKIRGAEVELISIDRAIASMMAGDPESSESGLKDARRRIDQLHEKDVREQTAAFLSDDKAVAWSGREYEARMIDNLLVLCSLLGDRQDAFAFVSEAAERAAADKVCTESTSTVNTEISTVAHSVAERKQIPRRFSANALTSYLHAAVHSEIPMNSDVAQNAIRNVGYWQASGHQIETATIKSPAIMTGFGVESPRNHGVLHVVTFVGRVTDWTSETAAPTSAALLLADQILSAVGDHTLPPTVAPVRIARPVRKYSSNPYVTTAAPAVGDARVVSSEILVDLNMAAWDSYQFDRNRQISRAVTRRIVKKSTVYATKDQLNVAGDSGVDIVLNLSGMAWEAMEKPDTRHLNLLPERIEVLQMELPVGDHTIRLGSAIATGDRSVCAAEQTASVAIENGRNTFVVCFRPKESIVAVCGGLPMNNPKQPSGDDMHQN